MSNTMNHETMNGFDRPELIKYLGVKIDNTFFIEQWTDDLIDLMDLPGEVESDLPPREPLDYYQLLVYHGRLARIRDDLKTQEIRDIVASAKNVIDGFTDQNFLDALTCFDPQQWIATANALYHDDLEEEMEDDEVFENTCNLFTDLDDILLVLAQVTDRVGYDAIEEFRNAIQPCLEWYEEDKLLFHAGTPWIMTMISMFDDDGISYSVWDLTELYFLAQLDKLEWWMNHMRSPIVIDYKAIHEILEDWKSKNKINILNNFPQYEIGKMLRAGVKIRITAATDTSTQKPEFPGDLYWESPDGRYIAERDYVTTSANQHVLRVCFYANHSESEIPELIGKKVRFLGNEYMINDDFRFEEENFESQLETLDTAIVDKASIACLEVELDDENKFASWKVQYDPTR